MNVENGTIKIFFLSFIMCFILFALLCVAILHEGYQCSENFERCNGEKDKAQFELLKAQEKLSALGDRVIELQEDNNKLYNMLEDCRLKKL